MAAYGALSSLLLTLNNICDHNLTVLLNTDQLRSLQVQVSFLVHCLKDFPSKRSNHGSVELEDLETKIRDVAFQAEDLISSLMIQGDTDETSTATMNQGNPDNTFAGQETLEARRLLFRIFPPGLVTFLYMFTLIFLCPLMIAFHVRVFMSLIHLCPVITYFKEHLDIILILLAMLCTFSFFAGIVWILKMGQEWTPPMIEETPMISFLKNESQNHMILNEISEQMKLISEEVTATIAGSGKKVQSPLADLPSLVASSSSRYACINATHKDTIVGMDSDLESMKLRLCGTGTSSELKIVPIVGMGGIGKTTLAMRVYKDDTINLRFDICAWATVSQEYSLCRVILDLLNSANPKKRQGEGDEGELGGYLHKTLYGRRYLIILDDVWDVPIWDDLRKFLPDDNIDSFVLLTTRSSEVARYTNSCGPQHQMRFLDKHESQKLLDCQVFGERGCPEELRAIQNEIAQRCKGLPLTLVVTGGLLSNIDRTKDNWRRFADSLRQVSGKVNNDDESMKILALSYKHLPHHLRSCFLYMGAFPEDYVIPVTKLIWLWLAEGFVRMENCRSPEELAEEYLEELVQRNLISVDGRNSQGKIKRCRIHDILWKLCLVEARREKFLYVVNRPSDLFERGIKSYHRLSIRPGLLETHPYIVYDSNLSTAQSLLSIGTNHSLLLSMPDKYSFHSRPLKVCNILGLHFFKFPLDLTRLVSLRYLGVSFSCPLHPFISRLQNLQTIAISVSDRHFTLPREIWMIPNLRHIHIVPNFWLSRPIERSTPSLQTLAEVINLRFGFRMVDKIKSLKKLCVSYDVDDRFFEGWPRYELQNLVHLKHLEKLKLRVLNFYGSGATYSQNLAFPQSLKNLTLSGGHIPWERLTIVGELPNLEVLKLRRGACQGKEWKPIVGQFDQLILLELQHVNLVRWRADEMNFPRLQCLTVNSCIQLEEIPLEIGNIPTLQRIDLINCHPGIVKSVENIQTEQEESMGISDIKVSVSYWCEAERR